MNNNLLGIVIDPGHGGEDPGATSNNQKEKDYTLKISKYMYDRFKELGIPVTITRDTDETLNPNDRTNRILNAYGNDPNIIVISNHLNSGGGSGAEIIYALRNKDTLSKSILDNIGKTGQNTRRVYQRRLPTDPSKDYYFIHRNTNPNESLIIEYGFIDNKNDINFINNNYKDLVEAVIKAILNYKGIPYTPPQDNTMEDFYTVKKGDTLYSVARQFNTTIDEIKRLNNLTSNNLSIGQKLIIPSPNINNTYTVKPGDTLYTISKLFNTTVDKIKELNNLTTNNLSIGTALIIPTNNEIEENINIEPEKVTPNNETYTVKSGETIYSIARIFNTTIDEIKRLNNLTSNLISVGQILKVPSQNITNTYIVKKGDTLYTISKLYNTTIDKIKELNNLTNNNLSIGQELIISK